MLLSLCRPLVLIVCIMVSSLVYGQTRIAFWNVENYFDTRNDTLTNDDDFTPTGSYHWTRQRYNAKRDAIAKTLVAMGMPAVVGLAEVENRWVLDDLCRSTLMAKGGYEVVHRDSPDRRGIDCALLYRKGLVQLLENKYFSVSDSSKGFFTRDILMVSFCLPGGDTVYCFVCHLPSRRSGERSEGKRQIVAGCLSRAMDSVSERHPAALVVAMGDFNATSDEVGEMLPSPRFCSLMDSVALHRGTYVFRGVWQRLDHAVAVCGESAWRCHADIFEADFLLEPTVMQLRQQPYRTYRGPRYHGGISDHLPIYVDCP